MTEQPESDTKHPRRMKHILLFATGVISTVIAQGFGIRNPDAYTPAAIAAMLLIQPISYFIILGIIALIVAALQKKTRVLWFPVLAWLFLVAGLCDVVVKGYTEFMLRPQLDKNIQKLIDDGIINLSQLPQSETDLVSRLRGHWASPDDLTHMYFSKDSLIVVNLGMRKDVTYRITGTNLQEHAIEFEVSGADYMLHTRTMVFLEDGSAWQIIGEAIKSKLNFVGKEESP